MLKEKETKHNHPCLEPEESELYHKDSDPRVLWETCPKCREIMQAWDAKVQRMIAENV